MNELAKKTESPFSIRVSSGDLSKLISNVLSNEQRRLNFTANLITLWGTSPAIRDCDPTTVVTAALQAEVLNLPLNNALGYFYVVPFNDNKNKRTVATPVIGYKGVKQLAQRTGQYKKLLAKDVKAGELVSHDPFTDEFVFNPITDPVKRAATETVGYYAMFRLLNGFEKAIYMSVEDVKRHAARYSKAYLVAEKSGKRDSLWHTDFDTMATKTVTRMLLLHDGVLTTEFAAALPLLNNEEHVFTVDMGAKMVVPELTDGETNGNREATDTTAAANSANSATAANSNHAAEPSFDDL